MAVEVGYRKSPMAFSALDPPRIILGGKATAPVLLYRPKLHPINSLAIMGVT